MIKTTKEAKRLGSLGRQKAEAGLQKYYALRRAEAEKKWAKKKCIGCSGQIPFDRRHNKYCSSECLKKYRRHRPRNPRYCTHCNTELVVRYKKKFCSTDCHQKHRYETNLKKWVAGELEGGSKWGVSSTVRRYLLESASYKCSQCGWSKKNPITKKVPLEIDHIDGDYRNNRPENLRVLCPNCHALTKTYGTLNRGNGRDWRYRN